MANPQTFSMYITNLQLEKMCLKIFGQPDKNTSIYIEKLLKDSASKFDQGYGLPSPSNLQIGGLYIAKDKDGIYYRAKIIGVHMTAPGNFEVKFLDFGNTDYVNIMNIRLIDHYLNALLSLPPQAVEFILAQVTCNSETTLSLLQREICYTEVECCNIAVMGANRIIRLIVNNVDLSQNLVNRNLAMPITLQDQDLLLNAPVGYAPQSSSISPMTSAIPFQYKCDKLEVGTQHYVYVSYVTEGPCLFSIQQQKMEEPLSKLMIDMSHHPLMPFADTPMEGSVCLARSIEMPEICRGVITNIVDGQYKVFFVDFGNTEILPINQIFQIPLKFVIPKVMSLRFILAGIEGIGLTHEMKVQFKNYVQDKLLRMEVVPTSGNVPIQRCNLYDADVNLLSVMQKAALLAYQPALAPPRGTQSVRVSYILSCNKFFVQLLNKADSLLDVMNKLSEYCPNAPPVTNIQSGLPCCALYSGDGQWYRAQIIVRTAEGVVVNFIDYGNEENVQPEYLRAISPNLVTTLRAQALECCLVGYQNMPRNEKLDELFEALTLEQDFVMKLIESRQNGVLLVDLTDSSGNQVAATLIEKLAATGMKQSPAPAPYNSSPQPREINRQRPSPRSQSDYTRTPSANKESSFSPPVKESWRDSWRASPPKHDERVNNAHNFYKRKDATQKQQEQSPPKREQPLEKRNSREREFKKKTSSDSFESTGRPFDHDNKENFGYKGREQFSSDRGGERQFKGGQGGGGGGNRGGGGGKDFRSNSRNEEQNGTGENFGKARSGFSAGGKKQHPRDQQKSFSSNDDERTEHNSNKATSPKNKQPEPQYASFSDGYKQQQLTGNTEKVSISWFHNPVNWFCQLESGNAEFRKLMTDIQAAYVSRAPEKSSVSVGASVVAQFNEDNVLYRATVLEILGFQYKVMFVDFGNVSTANRIWKIEKRFMILPAQAINCAISGIAALNGGETWPASSAFDAVFNKDSFECRFESADAGKYWVVLTHGAENLAETLIQANLASNPAAAAAVPPETQVACRIDEPVAIYLLYAQTVAARLSSVESPAKFYVQLEPWKVDNMSALTETLYNNGQLSRLADNPELETVCVTKLSSGSWTRGIVKGGGGGSDLNVLLPDWGYVINAPSEIVYNLPAALNDWYQSYECSLPAAVAADEAALDTLRKYQNQSVILHVEDVVETQLCVSVYDSVALTPLLPSPSGPKTVEPICAFPVLRERTRFWVSHVSTAAESNKNHPCVFVQSSYMTSALDALLDKVGNFYAATASAQPIVVPEVNKTCAALSSDGNWYRALIVAVDKTQLNVQFLDYGNTEWIEAGNVRALDASLYEPHRLALELRLNYLPSAELGEELAEALTDKEFKADIFDKNEEWYVELTAENEENALKELLEKGLLVPVPELPEETQLMQTETAAGDTNSVSVVVSHADSPGQFYVQLLESSQALEKLQADLQDQVLELPVMESPCDGVLCAAPYSVDQMWYRAQVLDADNDITTVRFIDFGNTDVINNTKTQVKTLTNTELLTVEPYARRCSLEVKPIDEEWSTAACERFEALIDVEDVRAEFVQQSERTAYVKLLVQGSDVTDILIKERLAEPDSPVKREHITGYVSHINSASEFWVQLESAVEDLENISYQLNNAADFPEVGDVSPGSLCCALFPDDDNWYRVRILSNTVAGIEVLFIDYGNSCTCSLLRALPEELIHLPVLAHKCSLKKPPGLQSWSSKANEKFGEIANFGATIFTVSNLTAGETSTVELLLNGKDISLELLNVPEESAQVVPVSAPETENEVEIKQGDTRIPVRVSYFRSAQEFWIVKKTDSGALNKITEALVNAPCWGALHGETTQDIIAAMCVQENRWYRAKILSKEAEDYKVLYVDYGATDETRQVRYMRDNLDAAAPYATCCYVEGTWSDEATENLAALVGKPNPGTLQVEILDDKAPCAVRLYLNGTDVCDIIKGATKVQKTPEAEEVVFVETTVASIDAAAESAEAEAEPQPILVETATEAVSEEQQGDEAVQESAAHVEEEAIVQTTETNEEAQEDVDVQQVESAVETKLQTTETTATQQQDDDNCEASQRDTEEGHLEEPNLQTTAKQEKQTDQSECETAEQDAPKNSSAPDKTDQNQGLNNENSDKASAADDLGSFIKDTLESNLDCGIQISEAAAEAAAAEVLVEKNVSTQNAAVVESSEQRSAVDEVAKETSADRQQSALNEGTEEKTDHLVIQDEDAQSTSSDEKPLDLSVRLKACEEADSGDSAAQLAGSDLNKIPSKIEEALCQDNAAEEKSETISPV